MKKILNLFLVLVLACSCVVFASCGEVVKNGITYTLNGKEYIVTAFDGSSTNVTIEGSIDGFNVTTISDTAFRGNKRIVNVTLPEQVTVLDASAFSKCEKLESINTENVKDFGASCFEACSVLTTVDLSNAKSIGSKAFKDCVKLNKKITIGEQVNEIKSDTFSGCKLIKEVEFQGDIERVGSNAFAGCVTLHTVNAEKIKYFDLGCFNGCKQITELKLLNCVEVSQNAFKNCEKLSKLTIGENAIYLSKEAFQGTVFATDEAKDGKVETSVIMLRKEGWWNVGRCANCKITEWATELSATSWNNEKFGAKVLYSTSWNPDFYLCHQDWYEENRPNGWLQNYDNCAIHCGRES